MLFPPLPALTGVEIARALTLAGFRLSNRGKDSMVLDQGWRTVSVPHKGAVSPQELHRVLAAAGISAAEFLVLLDCHQSGDASKVG